MSERRTKSSPGKSVAFDKAHIFSGMDLRSNGKIPVASNVFVMFFTVNAFFIGSSEISGTS